MKYRVLTILTILGWLTAAAKVPASAQTFTNLATFSGSSGPGQSGANPEAGLVQGTDGNFYGTTYDDGGYSYGTVFRVTPTGTVKAIYSFCSQPNCTDGSYPEAGLILGTDGNFYGTTGSGGANGFGTAFKINSGGSLTRLYSFCAQTQCADGANPQAGLIQATDGNYYGTTFGGGMNGSGTVFKMTSEGALTTLYSFCMGTNCADGAYPSAVLVEGTDGNLYGTTVTGGLGTSNNPNGTIFKITTSGTFTSLYSFCMQSNCPDGDAPAGLVQATNGNFYGATYYGGANCPAWGGCGTVFELSPQPITGCATGSTAGNGWCETVLYSFCSQANCSDGAFPSAGLIQATDANFYGTTEGGFNADEYSFYGTIFQITLAGNLTTLHSFDVSDGEYPMGVLLQATNGSFYGTTNGGDNPGTIFSLSMGLPPFAQTVNTAAKIGTKVTVLGNNLTGASAVSFNETAASFTVPKSTEIKATVPAGATTGPVSVTMPSSTLSTPVSFGVLPAIKTVEPKKGPVGTVVTITGSGLTQTSAITFGGVSANNFTVDSDTEVTATVPTGAVTGNISITTLGGVATSKATFTVTQ